jgi:hypothetical protein
MTPGTLLYPRLPRHAARQLIADRIGMGHEELLESAELSHPEAEPSATGGHPADAAKIEEIQVAIREVSRRAGFPKPLGGSTQSFDRPCGSVLMNSMDIVPADAAEEGVWSFLTLVVVPEIGPWRFPALAEERLIGRPRNVLRRTWWRAWALGPDLSYAPQGCEPLGEDESVQIMERPSLGGNRRTAHALQSALWRAEQQGLPVPRSELMRQLARRGRAVKSHIQFDALTDEALEGLLDRITDEALDALAL